MDDEQLARIVEQLVRRPEEDFTVMQVVEQAMDNIPDCDMCSVFMRRNGTTEVAATTDPRAEQIDLAQMEFDEGPCLSVIEHAEINSVPDTARDERWPQWSRFARSLGARSSLSVRLATEPDVLASLNLYSRRTSGFDEDAIDRALVYARLATVALGHAREVTGLRTALTSRMVIGAAEGILMERYGLSLDRAFEVLRRQSNETNTKLRDVAQQVVDGTALRRGNGEAAEPPAS